MLVFLVCAVTAALLVNLLRLVVVFLLTANSCGSSHISCLLITRVPRYATTHRERYDRDEEDFTESIFDLGLK